MSERNRELGIWYIEWSTVFYDITRVVPLADYRLRLTFDDGAEGEIDLRAQIPFTGVFEPLREQSEFRKVRVNSELGTIEWPNNVDLDPIVLYAAVTGKTNPWPDGWVDSFAGLPEDFERSPQAETVAYAQVRAKLERA